MIGENTKIPEKILDKYREKFIGKRVIVQKDGERIGGICDFIGYNKFLPDWGLQVTVNRMPINNIKIGYINLIEKKLTVGNKK